MSLFTQFYPSAGKTQNSLFGEHRHFNPDNKNIFKIFPLTSFLLGLGTQGLSAQPVNFVASAIKILKLDEILQGGDQDNFIGRESRNLCGMITTLRLWGCDLGTVDQCQSTSGHNQYIAIAGIHGSDRS